MIGWQRRLVPVSLTMTLLSVCSLYLAISKCRLKIIILFDFIKNFMYVNTHYIRFFISNAIYGLNIEYELIFFSKVQKGVCQYRCACVSRVRFD